MTVSRKSWSRRAFDEYRERKSRPHRRDRQTRVKYGKSAPETVGQIAARQSIPGEPNSVELLTDLLDVDEDSFDLMRTWPFDAIRTSTARRQS